MQRKFLIKLLTIAALVVALTVPTLMIRDLVLERSAYRSEAKRDIASSWTGAQTLYGPVLVVPYTERREQKVWNDKQEKFGWVAKVEKRRLFVLPSELRIDAAIRTEERSRGIYGIPVYQSKIDIGGHFDGARLRELAANEAMTLDLDRAFLSVPLSDIRGISTEPALSWNGDSRAFVSGSGIEQHDSGMRAPVNGLADATSFEFGFSVRLRGMERLQFSPVGRNTLVDLRSDWRHPSFIGRYLPAERQIDDSGFVSRWRLAAFSGDMERAAAQCESGQCGLFLRNIFGVGLIHPVDIYQQLERSLKYALLIIALSFVAFFLFEVMCAVALHPMQYLLVGCSLTVFYLLLLSLSEHVAFGWAYLVATLADVSLIGAYFSAVLQSRGRAMLLSASLLAMYGMLFLILRSEGNALLMGSLLIFAVLALVMMLTRRLDWYRVSEQIGVPMGSRHVAVDQ